MGVLQHQRGRGEQAPALIRALDRAERQPARLAQQPRQRAARSGPHRRCGFGLREAVRLGPERADIYNNLGVLRREQHRPAEPRPRTGAPSSSIRSTSTPTPTSAACCTAWAAQRGGAGRFCTGAGAQAAPRTRAPGARHGLLHARPLRRCGAGLPRLAKDEPDSPEALHHLAACSGEACPSAPPMRTWSGVRRLRRQLRCQAGHPAATARRSSSPRPWPSCCGEPPRTLTVLDAGCGTGLCGPLLAPYAQRLRAWTCRPACWPGPAPPGLRRAGQGRAHRLHRKATAPAYDLIVSADTLCYFGDLGDVTRAAAAPCDRAAGWSSPSRPCREAPATRGLPPQPARPLQPSRGLPARGAGQRPGSPSASVRPAHLRIEGGQPVEGFVVAAQVGARPSGVAPATRRAAGATSRAAVLNSGVPGVRRVRYSAPAMRWRWKPVFSTCRQVAGVGTAPMKSACPRRSSRRGCATRRQSSRDRRSRCLESARWCARGLA